MKKLVVTVLTLLTNGVAFALPMGNPSEASLFSNGVWCKSSCSEPCSSWCDGWSLRLGFYGDYVFNRHMKVDDESVSSGANRDIEMTQLNTNAGYLALNFCDRLDLFGTFGATHIHMLADSKALGFLDTPSGNGTEAEIEFATNFSWSVGGRATLWECRCFALGIEGQYFKTNPDLDFIALQDNRPGSTLQHVDEGNRTHYREWQVGLGASYHFATSCPTVGMTPYIGVKWSGSKFETERPVIRSLPTENIVVPDFESKKTWGWAVGMTLTLCDMAGVTVEGRFADETAVYVNGEVRF